MSTCLFSPRSSPSDGRRKEIRFDDSWHLAEGTEVLSRLRRRFFVVVVPHPTAPSGNVRCLCKVYRVVPREGRSRSEERDSKGREGDGVEDEKEGDNGDGGGDGRGNTRQRQTETKMRAGMGTGRLEDRNGEAGVGEESS